jgi:hypothetical protein
MPREQPQQLLSCISGGTGDGHAGRGAAGAARNAFTRLHSGMHQKEYLYTLLSIQSTKIDEYS